MKKALRWLLVIATLLLLLPVIWIACRRSEARLDLTNDDDSYCAGKSIGLVPASGEIYAEGVGFVDSTIYYQAKVSFEEVAWLKGVPVASSIEPPASSPLWWQLALWWYGRSPDIQYFKTVEKWPCIYAYSREAGMVFGTLEFE